MNMDLGPAPKVASVPASAPVTAVTSQIGSISPGTEMAASRVVLSTGESVESGLGKRPSPQKPASADALTERRVTIDAGTHEIVQQSIDARSNLVVSQFPDQARLGLRAYFERMAENSTAKSMASANDGGQKVTRIQA